MRAFVTRVCSVSEFVVVVVVVVVVVFVVVFVVVVVVVFIDTQTGNSKFA